MNVKEQYLEMMGIEVWKMKNTQNTQSQGEILSSSSEITWDSLRRQVANCTLCDLCKTRTNIVFGVGNENADVLFIGEAPGENEDLQGEPFVGRAGMLLNEMIRSLRLERKDVYIANILKCRPPRNRDPLPLEIDLCTPYLKKQIALLKPKIIIAVGRVAAHHLLNTEESMGRLRGRQYTYGDFATPLFVIYHPAYLLRSPSEKGKAYEDLKHIYKFLQNKL